MSRHVAAGERLQVGEGDLFLAALLADQADHHLGGAEALEGQQALVDVADLLDVSVRNETVRRSPVPILTVCTARSMCSTVRSSTVSGSHGYASGSNSEPSWAMQRQLAGGRRRGRRRVNSASSRCQAGERVLQLALVAARVGDPLLQLGDRAARPSTRGAYSSLSAGSRPRSSANSRKTIRIITVTAPR